MIDLIMEENKAKIKEGKCHGCEQDVGKNVCIWATCVRKGVTHKSLGLLDELRKIKGETRGWEGNWWEE